MKILLLGEYSGLHVNLAEGLRSLGHEVVVASDGDFWKDYPRDINFKWHKKFRKLDILKKLAIHIPRLRGYDVVQLINPVFLELKPQHNLSIFRYLKKHNKSIFLGANGDDYFYIKHALSGAFLSSIYNNEELKKIAAVHDAIANKLSQSYQLLNTEIALNSNGITACCTEYKLTYAVDFNDKLKFIPLPIKCEDYSAINSVSSKGKLNFFLGIQEKRKVIKGMDIIYDALVELETKYPDKVELRIANSVPFEEYKNMLDSSHILCDQLYSYGNGMNGVMAMAKGLIVAGGGEDYMYELFGETENKPIINLPDTKEGVIEVFESLLERRDELPSLALKSREFALKHHDHIKVAQQYVDFWESKML